MLELAVFPARLRTAHGAGQANNRDESVSGGLVRSKRVSRGLCLRAMRRDVGILKLLGKGIYAQGIVINFSGTMFRMCRRNSRIFALREKSRTPRAPVKEGVLKHDATLI